MKYHHALLMIFTCALIASTLTIVIPKAFADEFGSEMCVKHSDVYNRFSEEGTFLEKYGEKGVDVWKTLLTIPVQMDSGFAFKSPSGSTSIFLFYHGCLTYNNHFESEKWNNVRELWGNQVYGRGT